MRSVESYGHDISLSDMVEKLNALGALSSALDTVAPLKIERRLTDRICPWLNENSVKEIKKNS